MRWLNGCDGRAYADCANLTQPIRVELHQMEQMSSFTVIVSIEFTICLFVFFVSLFHSASIVLILFVCFRQIALSWYMRSSWVPRKHTLICRLTIWFRSMFFFFFSRASFVYNMKVIHSETHTIGMAVIYIKLAMRARFGMRAKLFCRRKEQMNSRACRGAKITGKTN